jgi:tetratricopeptide (TPR) repeat protein
VTRRTARFAVAAALVLVSAVAYGNAAHDALVNDDRFLGDLPDDTGEALSQAFRYGAWRMADLRGYVYRPLAIASIAVESRLTGGSPSALHAGNVVLHVSVVLLLFLLLEQVLRPGAAPAPVPAAPPKKKRKKERPVQGARSSAPPWDAPLVGAAAAAMLWAVHPVHTDAVDSIFNRSEMLAAIASLGALLWTWRYAGAEPRRAWIGAGVLYFVALLCKESAATLPVLLALVLAFLRFDGPWRARARRLGPALLLVIPLALYLVLRDRALAENIGSIARATEVVPADLGILGRLGVAATCAAEELRLLVWPVGIRADASSYPASPQPLLAAAVHVTLLAVAAWAVRRRPVAFVAIALFYVALTPSLLQPFPASRFLYWPTVGLALGIGAAVAAVPRARLALAASVCAMIATVLVSVTRDRNEAWRDSESLWRAEIAAAPADGDAWMHLTTHLILARRNAEVVRICDEHADRVSPSPQLFNNCAVASQRAGRADAARGYYERALRAGAGASTMSNYARLLAGTGDAAEAERRWLQAIEADPNEASRHVRRAEMLLRLRDDVEGARAEYEAALAIDPEFRPAVQGVAGLPRP